jgi:hypothetical protein
VVPPSAPQQPKVADDKKKQLMEHLAQLSPEQIAQLPEEVRRQVLDIMRS